MYFDVEILLLGVYPNRSTAIQMLRETCLIVICLKLLVAYPVSISLPNYVFGGSVFLMKDWHFLDFLVRQKGPVKCKQKSLGGTWGQTLLPFPFLLSGVWNLYLMARVAAAVLWPWGWKPHTKEQKNARNLGPSATQSSHSCSALLPYGFFLDTREKQACNLF